MSNLVSGWRSCGEQTEKKRDEVWSKDPRQDCRPPSMDELKVVSDPVTRERSEQKEKKKNRSESKDPTKYQAHLAINKRKVTLHPVAGRRLHKERSEKNVSRGKDTQQAQSQSSPGQQDAMYDRCDTYKSQINESFAPHNQGTTVYYRGGSNMEGEWKNGEYCRSTSEDKGSQGDADGRTKGRSRGKGHEYRKCPSRTDENCH